MVFFVYPKCTLLKGGWLAYVAWGEVELHDPQDSNLTSARTSAGAHVWKSIVTLDGFGSKISSPIIS